MKYQPGWGINLSNYRWHRLDQSKGEGVAFCGVGVIIPDDIVNTPYPPAQKLTDLLSGHSEAPACRRCTNGQKVT